MHKYYAAVLALATAMVDGKPTHPQRDSLPKCAEAPADCKCPAGTELQYSTTYALIGAAAKDVKAITGSCKHRPFSRFTDLLTISMNSFRYCLVW